MEHILDHKGTGLERTKMVCITLIKNESTHERKIPVYLQYKVCILPGQIKLEIVEPESFGRSHSIQVLFLGPNLGYSKTFSNFIRDQDG